MNKKFIIAVSFLVAVLSAHNANAQTDSVHLFPTYRVGIFAPLYLDSVFSNNNFRYKQGIPKFIAPALDFVQGAQVALDSMKLSGENVQAYIYDTRSYTKGIYNLIQAKKLDSLDLIIGNVKDADYKQLAAFALQKNIPFVSATYPNDGNVTANPFTIIMNSTLRAHCEAIFAYLIQDHGTDKILLCRKKGEQEDKVASFFKAINDQDGKPLLNIQTLYFDSTMDADNLKKKMDSTRSTVIIGGSLEESFAKNLTSACNDLHTAGYPVMLIGMPNWEGFASLHSKDDFEDFPIYFTTPYYNAKLDNFSRCLTAAYSKRFKTKPSDNAFKGFECAYSFTRLLAKYPNDMMSHLNDPDFKVFCEYNFKPVLLKKNNSTPDYFENKHLYLIKIVNGVASKAW